jgi:hypothetical protein
MLPGPGEEVSGCDVMGSSQFRGGVAVVTIRGDTARARGHTAAAR